jgi:hypothetical protein
MLPLNQSRRSALMAAILWNSVSLAAANESVEPPASASEIRVVPIIPAKSDAADSCNSNGLRADELHSAWYVSWENDSHTLALISGSDEFYTQGFQLGYRFPSGEVPAMLNAPSNWLCDKVRSWSGEPNGQLVGATTLFIGQNLFTPGKITEVQLDPQDRPYAAWLYSGARLQIKQQLGRRESEDDALYHVFEVQVGTTGPPAEGKWAQSSFHELTGVKSVPMGWHHQMKTEPGIQTRYRLDTRLGHKSRAGGAFETDYILSTEFLLGTLQTSGAVGATLRIGRNLTDPPSNQIVPTVPSLPFLRTKEDRSAEIVDPNMTVAAEEPPSDKSCLHSRLLLAIQECSLFFGALGRVVAHNSFIDGSLFRDGHSVDGEIAHYDLLAGFRLRWERFQLDYTYVRRGKEFSPVPVNAENTDGHHGFGAVNIQCLAGRNPGDLRLELVCPSVIGVLIGLMLAQ